MKSGVKGAITTLAVAGMMSLGCLKNVDEKREFYTCGFYNKEQPNTLSFKISPEERMGIGRKGEEISIDELKSMLMAKVGIIRKGQYKYKNPYVLTAEEVEEARVGACMEVGVVVLKFLRKLDIEAKPLILEFFYKKQIAPSLFFVDETNHMVVAARIKGDTYIIDPLNDVWACGLDDYCKQIKKYDEENWLDKIKIFGFKKVDKLPKKISVEKEKELYKKSKFFNTKATTNDLLNLDGYLEISLR